MQSRSLLLLLHLLYIPLSLRYLDLGSLTPYWAHTRGMTSTRLATPSPSKEDAFSSFFPNSWSSWTFSAHIYVIHDVISGSSIPYSGLRALTHMVAAGEGPPNKYIPQYDSRLNLGLFTARNVEDLRAYRMAGALSFVAENKFDGRVKSGDRVGAIRPRRSCCISQILHPSVRQF